MSSQKPSLGADALLPKEWELPEWTLTEFLDRRHEHVLLIPVLNEGERIRRQLRKLKEYARLVDIAIVDGGSRDGALEEEFLRQQDVRALMVKLGRGRLGAQLRIGLAGAMREGYRGVILMDGNDKDDPGAIPEFIRRLDSGGDHVQGSRYLPGGVAIHTPFIRAAAIRLIHAPLLSLCSGFR
ncbi:MAG TPA: glycosyltransferase, partial [Rhodothermales bacterium]|nr:glycosyltransferase [Rhodothermales bacterium]